MSTAYEQALAEIRAIRTPQPAEPVLAAAPCPFGCHGDDRGYQWHQRTGNLPACEPALLAHRTYTREYLRQWRARRPNYHRDWRAMRKAGDLDD